MRKNTLPALALGFATAVAGSCCFAQDQASAGISASYQSISASDTSKSILHSQDMKDLKHVQASKLIGVNVTSKDGENLGQVQDFVIDPSTGRIKFALVGNGFMAGLGEKMLPVPWAAVNVHSQREFALNVDKQKLQSAPSWSQSDMEQPDYILRIYRFYQLEPQTDVGGLNDSTSESGKGAGSSSDTLKDRSIPRDDLNDQFKDSDLRRHHQGDQAPD